MITFLDGELVEKDPGRLVLDVNGVGYEVTVPLSSHDRLPAVGARCRILTWLCIREDAHLLFGFASADERALFLLLMTVSGIGPKMALSALGGLSVRELKAAIAGGDAKRLSGVPGIGRKTAERLILELKDKIPAGEAAEAMTGGTDERTTDVRARDGVLALIALGFKQAEAQAAVREALPTLKPEDPVQELVRLALRAKARAQA